MDSPKTPSQTADEAAERPLSGEPLLNLSTLIERPRIRIDAALFEILSPDEISIIDGHRLGSWGRRINVLAEMDGDEAEAELSELIGKVARKVAVGVPDDVFAQLSGAHKQAIADVFTGLLLQARLGVAGAIAKAAGMLPGQLANGTSNSTGASSSPDSSISTEAARTGGWLKRLLASFART